MSIYEVKKAVITGGTHGMGLAIAKGLLEKGVEVLVTGRNEQNMEAAQLQLGPHVHVVRSDAASMDDINQLGQIVKEKFGKFDFLYINAGYAKEEPFEKVTEETFDQLININTKGPFFTVQRLAPLMNDGGSILFTTTVGAQMGYPGMSAYHGAKAALRSFMQTLAAEMIPRRIRVNAVAPSIIKTPSMGLAGAPEEERKILQKVGAEIIPMKRIGSAEEVARAALYLTFDATFTTGLELAVDGGVAQGIVPPVE